MAAENPTLPNPAANVPVASAPAGFVAGTTAAAAQVGKAADAAVAAIGQSIEKIPGVKDSPVMASVRQITSSPSVKRALPLLVLIFVAVVFAALYNLSATPTTYRPLMPGISEADQQAALEALKAASFDAKVDPANGMISVPTNKYHEARIYLASKGIPKQAPATGIEALSTENAMTTSQFMEQVKYVKAMEQELARSITQIGSIQSARVHLALPKQSVFVRDRAQPKASVVVSPFQGRTITAGQVDAIVHLISSSVPYLAASNVSVVDNVGNLLTNRKENTPMGLTEAQLAHKQQVEDLYRSRIMQILSPVMGEANVRSQVDVQLDFSQSEVATEDYDRSKSGPKTRSEVLAEDRTQRLGAEGVPGSLTNAPPPPANQTTDTASGSSESLQENTTLSKRATRNYELDKTIRYVKNPTGNLMRLSVAVVVNEKPIEAKPEGDKKPEGADAAPAPTLIHGYSQEELDRLTALVRGVVGYQEDRGDVVTIVPAKFAPPDEVAPPWYADEAIMKNVKLGVAALIFMIVLFTIVNPLINFLTGRTLTAEQLARIHAEEEAMAAAKVEAERAAQAQAALAAEMGASGFMMGPDGQPVLGPDGQPIPIGPDGQPLQKSVELSPEEMGMIELEDGESFEEIKAKLKPKKSSISVDMLNTANSYDDKVALIRFLVSEDSGRVATVMKNLMRPAGGA